MNCALKDVSTCYDKKNTVHAHFEALMVLRYPSTRYLAIFNHDPAYLAECDYFDTLPEDVFEMWMVSLQSVRDIFQIYLCTSNRSPYRTGGMMD